MSTTLSTLGIEIGSSNNLSAGLATLNLLNQQLASQKKSQNLTDYTANDAQQVLNFTSSIGKRDGFLAVIDTVNPRLQVYDSALTGIEKIASGAENLVETSANYNVEQNSTRAQQIQGYLSQMSYYLNQQVNGRYVFAGSRYNTTPVRDMSTLGTPSPADIAGINSVVSSQNLPAYDSQASLSATVNIGSSSLFLTSKFAGTFGNGVSMTLSAGTISGIKATISIPGQASEVYDNVAGSGSTFWSNLNTAINAGSRLVTSQTGPGTTEPTLGVTYNLANGTSPTTPVAATTTLGTSDISFTAASTGVSGNNISVTLSPGSVSGEKAVVTDGITTETYDNIGGSGATFWSNLANAINTAPSALITASALGGANAPPGLATAYPLSGGADTSIRYAATNVIANNLSLIARNGGTAGNGITCTLLPGSVSGEQAVITDGVTTETYDNIGGAGATFWQNLADAINTSPASALVVATALGGAATPPATSTTFTLGGGVATATSSAYALDQVAIDTAQMLNYGVSSDAQGFQQMIMGLRLAYAATQEPANYTNYITQAQGLIQSGLNAIRGLHTGVANANTTLNTTKDQHTTLIDSLKGQIDDIENVDVNAIAVKINSYQAQLQASYSVTAKMVELSILKYL